MSILEIIQELEVKAEALFEQCVSDAEASSGIDFTLENELSQKVYTDSIEQKLASVQEAIKALTKAI